MTTKSNKSHVWFLSAAAFLTALALYPASFLLAVGLSALGFLPEASRDVLNKVYAPALWVWSLLS
jgi:hypothetical protein